jgi:hypothetical protein
MKWEREEGNTHTHTHIEENKYLPGHVNLFFYHHSHRRRTQIYKKSIKRLLL